MTMTECSFKDIEGRYGGALYINGRQAAEASLALSLCSFVNCAAINSGAALNSFGFALNTIDKCFFKSMTLTDGSGAGAVCFDTTISATITDCVFMDCTAGDGVGSGGAVYVVRTELHMESVQFRGNSAKRGSDVYGDDYISSSIPSISHQVLIKDSTHHSDLHLTVILSIFDIIDAKILLLCSCAVPPLHATRPRFSATRDMSSDSSIIPRLVSLVAWCTLFVEVPSKIVSSILHPLLHSLSALTLFSTANGNKIMIVKSDAYQLSSACSLAHPSSRSLPHPAERPHHSLELCPQCVGAIDTLLDASIRSEVDLQTIETTLGALLSLTVNAENKSYVREHNGLPLLVSGLARFQITPHTPQHIPVLHTALTTPRNCCSNGVLLAALSPHAPPSVTKEAVLLVKNLTLVDQNKKESLQPNLDSSSRKKVRAHFQEPTVDELLGILVGDADRWCGGTFGRNDVEILFRKALSERSCSTLERATDVISLYLNKALICS
ncbi:hypothetical protein BLNAU_21414 [Blattamonas nauphoetae]|uniref:Right handed beta helix domain-containing protein n=1 Tax=Blattamonas nauphoetae TaxID=2049346 RepID=A0ABQ9WVY7_9EUKA|nr:hypothetical protein BLNAU_21414 [Blattamonas nauphoetae]